MISNLELLDIIATEAIEDEIPTRREEASPNTSQVNYPLRLVRYEDGRLEWKD